MNTFDGYTKFISTPEMEMFPFGLMFFNDEKTVYVSPKIYEGIHDGSISSVEYAMVFWRKESKTISDLVTDIIKEVIQSLNEKDIPINEELVKRLHGIDISDLSGL